LLPWIFTFHFYIVQLEFKMKMPQAKSLKWSNSYFLFHHQGVSQTEENRQTDVRLGRIGRRKEDTAQIGKLVWIFSLSSCLLQQVNEVRITSHLPFMLTGIWWLFVSHQPQGSSAMPRLGNEYEWTVPSLSFHRSAASI
jgi:hypothetical protein